MKKEDIMKNIRYIISIGIIIATCTACDNEEFFELEAPPQAPWLSLSDLEKAPIGAYYALTGNGGTMSIFGSGRIAGEVFADGVRIAPDAEDFDPQQDAVDMYNRTTTGTGIAIMDRPIFNSGYLAVGHANGAIDFIEENNDDPFRNPATLNEVARIKGELYFVRAYAYYWLARIYLPAYPNDELRIPFRVNQALNFDEAITSELASANMIYDQIVSDLRTAKDLLPERYEDGVHDPSFQDGRANKFAAAALLSKVLFHIGSHDEALEELNFVIDQNGGDYDLSEDPIEAWNKTGIARGREVIWYYTLWTGDGLGGSSGNWKHPRRFEWYNTTTRDSDNPADNGSRFIVASDEFLTRVGWMDPGDLSETTAALDDKRYTQLFSRFEPSGAGTGVEEPRGAFEPSRPYVWGSKYYRSGVRRSTNLPILRLADMYLLRATIHASAGGFNDARSDLNAVRNRAGLADYAGMDADLLDAIEVERMIEMAFEGDRLYYLQGLQKDIPDGDRGTGSTPWNDAAFYSEIPDYEIDLNRAFSGSD